MQKMALGVFIGFLLLPVCGLLYISLGYAPVATASAPMPFEKSVAKMALAARVKRDAPKSAPISSNEQSQLAGAEVYRTQCAMCHGLPGQRMSPASKGRFPKPPQLFAGHGVTDDPVGETYWKVANGIRMSGMPAFAGYLSETEMWEVSLTLAEADKLSGPARSTLLHALSPTQ